MKSNKLLYHHHRFPQDIIRHTVRLYYRFCLSYRDVEDLLSERGISVSYETIRRWCLRFGPLYANRLRKRSRPCGDQSFVDEAGAARSGDLKNLAPFDLPQERHTSSGAIWFWILLDSG